jgi:serine/threonine protein kinase
MQPDNVLYLLKSAKWSLLDLGIAAHSGAHLADLADCLLAARIRAARFRAAWRCADHRSSCTTLRKGCLTDVFGVRSSDIVAAARLQARWPRCTPAYAPPDVGTDDSASPIRDRMRAGETAWPRCTPAYAPPEVVNALQAHEEVQVSPAHDMWALGQMAFEAIVQQKAFSTMEDVYSCAAGSKQYPWELPKAEQPAAWRHSRLRGLVAPCLERDGAKRPTARALVAKINDVAMAQTIGA